MWVALSDDRMADQSNLRLRVCIAQISCWNANNGIYHLRGRVSPEPIHALIAEFRWRTWKRFNRAGPLLPGIRHASFRDASFHPAVSKNHTRGLQGPTHSQPTEEKNQMRLCNYISQRPTARTDQAEGGLQPEGSKASKPLSPTSQQPKLRNRRLRSAP